MSYELKPQTEAGEKFVEASENVITKLRSRASISDQSNSIDEDNFFDMRIAGVSTAFLPQTCGGLELVSIHDWMVGMSRLGRGDGSAAIAMNMHLVVSRNMVAIWNAAQVSGNNEISDRLEKQFDQIVTGEMYMCATSTESGTDNLHPFTEVTEVDGGWRINGKKIFVTGSPVASHVAMNLRMRGDKKSIGVDGGDSLGSIVLPLETEGVKPQDDWKALGMRGSGSQSLVFENVFVPKSMVRPTGPWGQWSTNILMNRNLANLPLVAVFLGISEYAHELAIEAASGNPHEKVGKPPNRERPGIQHMIGEMEISLSTMRSMVGQMGQIMDEFLKEYHDQEIPLERAHELLKDHQSMKWVVNRNAIEIVNRAMDIVGGSGFMDRNPLSRLYRDVRAGPLMQPYSPTEAREYIGKVMLGVYPVA